MKPIFKHFSMVGLSAFYPHPPPHIRCGGVCPMSSKQSLISYHRFICLLFTWISNKTLFGQKVSLNKFSWSLSSKLKIVFSHTEIYCKKVLFYLLLIIIPSKTVIQKGRKDCYSFIYFIYKFSVFKIQWGSEYLQPSLESIY